MGSVRMSLMMLSWAVSRRCRIKAHVLPALQSCSRTMAISLRPDSKSVLWFRAGTINQAAALVASGFYDLVVAGGVESMSRVKMGSDGGALFGLASS